MSPKLVIGFPNLSRQPLCAIHLIAPFLSTAVKKFSNQLIFNNQLLILYCLNKITRMQRCSGLTSQCYPEHPSIRVIMFRHLIARLKISVLILYRHIPRQKC